MTVGSVIFKHGSRANMINLLFIVRNFCLGLLVD